MDTIETARKVILDAEAALKDLISKALEEQRYADVREIADLANGVAQLLKSNSIQLSVWPSESVSPVRDQIQNAMEARAPSYVAKRARPAAKRKSGNKKGYPKFVRDEDRLVKIGWSKKNKEEYEHRVPREALLSFVRHLDNKVEEAKVFDIDSLLPVSDPSGGEVPGYQIYVIVAWLREADIIEKKGRDGYVIRDKSVLSGELDEQWKSLPTRSA